MNREPSPCSLNYQHFTMPGYQGNDLAFVGVDALRPVRAVYIGEEDHLNETDTVEVLVLFGG